MNENYWPQFYKKDEAPHKPSAFALHSLRFIPLEAKIVDLGCGNGRDTYIFAQARSAKNKEGVTGIDTNTKPANGHGAAFVQGSYKEVNFDNFDVIYSRFFLHTITQEEVGDLIQRCANSKASYFMAEARSEGDVPKVYADHERNFINGQELLMTLHNNGYDILYYEKGYGLAPYKSEDPLIVRVIAKKIWTTKE